jgi:hypothetical protein
VPGNAQYPQQQPYPPTQYPPGQYPPGQYPPGSYPTRLPGGIPVEIPTIKLPKRKPKEDSKEAKGGENPSDSSVDKDFKVALRSVDGTLRKLGEKDLLLQTAPARVLRFRLLVKTQFRDQGGDPVRDSLLHPGDQLTVQVNEVDEETALRVVLLRSGSSSERAAAGKLIDPATVSTPSTEDLGGSAPSAAPETATAAPTAQPEAPAAPAKAPDLSAPRRPDNVPTSLPPEQQVLLDAREAADSFAADLPNFLAEQVTTRARSVVLPPHWETIDVVTAEVAYSNGREEYRNIRINGQPTTQPIEKTGTWTTGEFISTLQDVLSPSTDAAYTRRGEEKVGNRAAFVYGFSVDQQNSHWILNSDDGRTCSPAYTGRLWIDKDSRRVLRIEQKADAIPAGFPYDRAESVIEYGFVRIDAGVYLLPVKSDNSGCRRGSNACLQNSIEFRNYRRFAAESSIKFD